MSAPTTERPGPAGSTTNEDGARFYDVDGEPYWSVTTALRAVAKEGLVRWAAGLAADAALAELPKLVGATRRRQCGNTFKRCEHDHRVTCAECPCGQCPACVRKWIANRHYYEVSRRAEEGARIHDVIEEWILSEGFLRPHDDDIARYITHFQAFLNDYGLEPGAWEMAEATVINRTHKYAGTSDGILLIEPTTDEARKLCARILQVPPSQARPIRVMVDYKSREKEVTEGKPAQLFAEMALQLTAYRRAEAARVKNTDIEMPMPTVDGAVVLQLRPDGYLFRPVVADEATFQAFLAALHLYRWQVASGTASVSSLSFRLPKEPKPEKKVAARKVAPAAAEPVPAASPTRKRTTAKKTTPPPAGPARPLAERVLGNPPTTLAVLPDDGIPF
jgi:hypothetical protein